MIAFAKKCMKVEIRGVSGNYPTRNRPDPSLKFIWRLKNDVQIRLVFDKIVFNPSIVMAHYLVQADGVCRKVECALGLEKMHVKDAHEKVYIK